jgi:membrane-bound lytic murein transglycosylase D
VREFRAYLSGFMIGFGVVVSGVPLAHASAGAGVGEATVAGEEEVVSGEAVEKPRIPVEINSHVERWIHYFSVRDRERFQRFLDRGQSYRDVVENVLEENDLPAELYYLAMIESGFRTDALSHASAVGVWQFIPGTGVRYGLRIDRYVDERRDPIRASEAAAKYLRDLYNVFGSWHLAMAAYNAGEMRVMRAVFNGRSRNFWDLVKAGVLPKETADYVPKFLAAVMIGQDPEAYGFQVGDAKSPYPNLEAVEVPGGIAMADLAEATKIPMADLSRFNPHLNTGRTPGNSKTYEIWFPAQRAAEVRAGYESIAKLQKRPAREIPVLASSRGAGSGATNSFHTVKRGETLASIAKQHKISVGHLKRMNELASDRVAMGARLRLQPKTYVASETIRYRVKRGENLAFIARKFNTTVDDIKKHNSLRKNELRVGQILNIESVAD